MSAMRVISIVLSMCALASPQSSSAQAVALTQLDEIQLSPRLRELTFTTSALATQPGFILGPNPTGQTKVRVLLPQNYDLDGMRRYPVLYLYHGGVSTYADWTTPGTRGDAEGITEGSAMIVVMPDGGIAGGYADWYNNGIFGPPMWMTYHLEQLIPWIDTHYRTIADRRARATAGASMGGGGTRYAAQRPDLIGITASFSGDIDITQPASDWRGAGAVISRLVWGDFTSQEVRWRGVNGPDLAKNLSNTDVSIFAGDTGSPEGTYISAGSAKMHERLTQLGIRHQYTLFPGMSHTWATFNKEFIEWLPRLREQFSKVTASPRRWERHDRIPYSATSKFSYSTIAEQYSMYGWNVQMQRNALEFSSLEVANPQKFSVIGSGSATVQTPTIGAPNIQFRATVTNFSKPELSSNFLVYSGSDGRLSVSVPIGTPNPFQQFTAAANAISTGPSTDQVPFQVFNNGSRFYRADVKLSITPTGLCQLIRTFTSHKGANESLCGLIHNLDKNGWRGNAASALLGAFRQDVAKRTGSALTQEQADTLVSWAEQL
jgi:S-formylglutathione hydrolase FrmB